MSIQENVQSILTEIPSSVKLIAISKTKPLADILTAYEFGQRIFGENKVQELVPKYEALPKDIEWHLVGHLQSNKVKYIANFVHMIHSVDSLSLLEEINKQAKKSNRQIHCLLQVHIAKEETKYGLSDQELIQLIEYIKDNRFENIILSGLMGMATNTEDRNIIKSEFRHLKDLFMQIKERYIYLDKDFKELSMGMSSDYKIAIELGSTMIRIGSLLFGERNYSNSQ